MVYRLKSNNSAQALKFYGKILAAALSHSTDTTEFAGVIPIPSSKKTSVHALILAEEIATATGLPLLNVLEKTEAPEQKTLSKTERRAGTSIHLKPNLNEEFTSDHVHPLKYVFVDDILTTGESFKQSCHILAGHQDNLAVTLFFRSKSE